MGMYTEFHFNARVKTNTPLDVLNILGEMVTGAGLPIVKPDHPLFETSRWTWMLRCDSVYFDADTHTTLRLDKTMDSLILCVRCNLKNYDDEIEKFVDWIMPYLKNSPGEFLGFSRYEETREPTLIYMKDAV